MSEEKAPSTTLDLAAAMPGATATMLPPGLYLRRGAVSEFSSIFLLDEDGSFRLRWFDGANGTWLQGAGRVAMVLEMAEGRSLKYEIRLQGDFACAVASTSGDERAALETARLENDGLETERLPKGFGEGAGKKAKKAKKTTGGSPKGKLAPKKKKGGGKASSRPGTPEKVRPSTPPASSRKDGPGEKKELPEGAAVGADGASSSPPAATADGEQKPSEYVPGVGNVESITVVEVRDGPYVIHEAVQCPPEAGETTDEMRDWIARQAKTALESEFGRARADEMRTEGFPFNHTADLDWGGEEMEEETQPPEAQSSVAAVEVSEEEAAMAC